MTVSTSTLFCIVCGREFRPRDADTVICPDCGGPPEAPAPSQPQGTVRIEQPESSKLQETLSTLSAKNAVEWKVGEVILEEYEVKGELGRGGMGVVYLLQHRHSGRQFAVKRALGLTGADRQHFLAELQTWIDLPEHENLVACRFFRTLGEEILIFADYVEGGSLAHWIQSGKLYEGGHLVALERMLDIAIQFAWGLHCLHRLGLVHQDVKPGNVLMGKDEQVALLGIRPKVSDFGLARARAVAQIPGLAGERRDSRVSWGGRTEAYCSPEQAIGKSLTPATDVWSWGVSLLEMFAGEVFWISGTVAAQALEIYQERERKQASIPPMPQGLAVLLRECFQEQPEARPDMNAVVEQLKAIYRQEVGKEYGRPLAEIKTPAIPPQKVGEPLHKAGVRWTEPRVWLEWALRAAGRDVAEAEDILQRTGATRRGELVAQLAAYDEAKRLYEEMVADGRAELREDLAQLCLNKALLHDTLGDAPGTVQEYKRAIGLLEQLVEREGRGELANDLAMAYMNKAIALLSLGEGRAALALYDRAIAIRERLVEREGRGELANDLAMAYLNKAVALRSLGEERAALGLYDRAIAVYERLVEREGRGELANNLAAAYMNKAVALGDLGEGRAALALCDRAIAIRERLVEREGRRELLGSLAKVKGLRAIVLINLGKRAQGVNELREAVKMLQAEVARGRADLQGLLRELSNNLQRFS